MQNTQAWKQGNYHKSICISCKIYYCRLFETRSWWQVRIASSPFNEVYLLSKFDFSSSSMTHFADFEQFKIASNFTASRQVKIAPTCLLLLFLGRSVISLSLDKMLSHKRHCKPSLYDKKFKNHSWGLAQIIFSDWISRNQGLPGFPS